ncbi:serine hydrolase domain-containing protein [Ilyomonas limi]|nr:serine hydrolase [Ilyomonas limi]
MKQSVFFLAALLLLQAPLFSQTKTSLPHSTPEAEGVSARGITTFLDSVANSKHEFHSFMLLRHGKVIAEGWWNPYRADLKHTLYSLSKSFTATAVGFAKAEGKLSLDDTIVSFFPDQLPDTVSPYLSQLTVKDLLTMSVGQEPDPTGAIVPDTNWVRRFLALPIAHQPGTTFLYNSMATFMLSAIVQKVTGEKVMDYLKPRLFEPLEITGIDWETSPKGINTGGWGLRLKTEDIAKFAQLFLQKGIWNGKRILPQGWVEEASTAKIIQHPDLPQAKRDSSDWEQGYCYQMWRCRHNAYRGDGAFGQYAIVMPEEDAVIAITSETADMQGELNLIWNILLPAMHKGKLPADKEADAVLQQKLASLALPVPENHLTSATLKNINGKTFNIMPNDKHIQTLSFDFKNNKCLLTVKTDTATYNLSFGAGKWEKGETTMRGPYLVNGNHSLAGLPAFKIADDYTWMDDNTLKLVMRYIESPHTETITCHFDGKAITVDLKPSFNTNAPGAIVTLKGERKE